MPNPRMYWWKGSDLAGLVAELTARGLENVRVEFRLHDMKFYVVDDPEAVAQSHDGDEGHNFTQTCPPTCPGG